jgi:hypothetical protein
VRVVRRGDDDRVQRLLRLEHLAKIFVATGIGQLFERLGRASLIDVTDSDNVFARNAVDVLRAFAARRR